MRKLYVIDKNGNRKTVSLTWIYILIGASFIIDAVMAYIVFFGV